MIEAIIRTELVERIDSPAFGIGGPVDQRRYPGQYDRAGTHRARLERHGQRAAFQSPVAQGLGCLSDREHFRVGRRVVVDVTAVVGAGDDLAVGPGDDGPDGDLVDGRGFAGLGQSGLYQCLSL